MYQKIYIKKLNPEESNLNESAANRQYFFEQLVVRSVLGDNNLPYFIASSSYYVHGGTSYDDYQMTDVVRGLAKQYKEGGRFGSVGWSKDNNIDEERAQDSYYEHFNYILSKAE